jgi:hypothetical protein
MNFRKTVNTKAQLLISGLLLAIALIPQSSHAQGIQEDGRIWLNVNVQSTLPFEGWNWYAELQPRWREEGHEFDQLIIRPAIFYKFSPKSSAWLGYERTIAHPAGKSNTYENRVWEQFSYQFDPINDWKIQSRTRLEQRTIESKQDVGFRFRQMVKVVKPISQTLPLNLILSDELFVNLNNTDWGASGGIDQNRAFIGLGYKVNSHANIEFGYLNQAVNIRTIDKENHVLSTTISLNY